VVSDLGALALDEAEDVVDLVDDEEVEIRGAIVDPAERPYSGPAERLG
jgi:hypothetical protein